ncbi:MAG: hypothetical protein LH465_05210 [Sphingomonas bacterium]|nr:hypothetical protein [Sphingomonas bacterium]
MRPATIAAAAAALLLGGAAVAVRIADQAGSGADQPTLALLTSLPLMFGEQFGIEGAGSATLTLLEQHYAVVPIAVADAASLKHRKLLLMAHPRAQPAEMLVELDRWVRAGGRLLLLADPKLEWESSRPLGDALRPPLYFADTGLLGHWGLRLDAPSVDGPRLIKAGKYEILASSPGRLVGKGACAVEAAGLVARCRIGRGQATVIADADFLNLEGPGALDGPTGNNRALLIDELERFDLR